MAVINMLPHGGAGIKGSKVFAWLEDGVVDTSETFGGMVGNTESNGKNNLSTIETDGYLRIYYTSTGYGRSMISTDNTVTAGAYDYVLFHIVSLASPSNAGQPLTWGGKTAKNSSAPTIATYTVGGVSFSDKWIAIPLVMLTSSNYFAFGGTIDCTIDKIYFVKIRS